MIQQSFLCLLLSLSFIVDCFSQSESGYIPPLDIPLVLSGNFGEMRRNHFHTGIDIKTQGKQGIPLLSISEGHISRIKVSPYGYGNALYIDHPDGRTSVYAHMRSFNDSIAAYIKEKQYEAETWAIEYYPESGELPVAQGEVIGLSGNSGSSSGPHLHFEIRETESEHPLNPLSFGIEVADQLSPSIKGLRVYPLDDFSKVEDEYSAMSFVAKKLKGNDHRIDVPIKVNGSIGLGIHTFDLMSNASNKYGVYRLEMYVGDVLHYAHEMQELDFDNFRQVNCHKDYELYHANRWRYHKCFPSKNNTLEIYETLIDDGRLWIPENDTVDVKFISSDIKGNSSTLSATLIGQQSAKEQRPAESGIFMDAGQDNVYLDSGLVVRIPKGRIYDDFYLHPSRKISPDQLSDEYCIHDNDLPLDDKIKVSVRSHSEVEASEQVVMEHTDIKGRKKYLATYSDEDWFEAENKSLGTYRLIQDTIAPRVTISGLNGKGKPNAITLSLSDDLSGVTEFTVTVDGSWLLMSYNASMSKAWGKLSDLDLESGDHVLKIEAFDLAGNTTTESISFRN